MNSLLGSIAVVLYIGNAILSFITMAKAMHNINAPRAVIIAHLFLGASGFTFAILYTQYLVESLYLQIGNDMDLMWALSHIVRGLGLNLLYYCFLTGRFQIGAGR